jgi:hypothetical protein
MISEPGSFKVYRTTQTDPDGVKDWLPMRKGIVDLPHRSVVGQAANERYLEALAAVHDTTPLRQLADSLCAPAWEPERRPGSPPAAVAEALPTPNLPSAQTAPTGVDIDVAQPAEIPTTPVEATPVDANARDTRRRVRALNPLATGDAALLEAVSRHEFLINGLRNRDLRALLFKTDPGSAQEHKKQSTAVTRQLRLLRGHGLIRKVPKTHRYIVTENGRRAITALLAARNASIEELTGCAA